MVGLRFRVQTPVAVRVLLERLLMLVSLQVAAVAALVDLVRRWVWEAVQLRIAVACLSVPAAVMVAAGAAAAAVLRKLSLSLILVFYIDFVRLMARRVEHLPRSLTT